MGGAGFVNLGILGVQRPGEGLLVQLYMFKTFVFFAYFRAKFLYNEMMQYQPATGMQSPFSVFVNTKIGFEQTLFGFAFEVQAWRVLMFGLPASS